MRLPHARARRLLAQLVAAVGHDVDHPGVTNAYLMNTGDRLALRYNDRSVLENHHAATTFAILADKRCDVLATLDAAQRRQVRSLMIEAILATDMAHHKQMIKDLARHAAERTENIPTSFSVAVRSACAALAERAPTRAAGRVGHACRSRTCARPHTHVSTCVPRRWARRPATAAASTCVRRRGVRGRCARR